MNEELKCKMWLAKWDSGELEVSVQQEVAVKEYDYDEEFRHLGYTASIIGKSSTALRELSNIAQRAKHVFFRKHSLRDTGVRISTQQDCSSLNIYPLGPDGA